MVAHLAKGNFGMETAFGRAMIDAIDEEANTFEMSMVGGVFQKMECRHHLHLRPEEHALFEALKLPEHAHVLDIGCGTGRHLQKIRELAPTAHCYGVEICDLLREYCTQRISDPATFVSSMEEVAVNGFDLILMMGNGLGVLGNEEQVLASLTRLVNQLNPDGSLIIEAGNPFGAGFSAREFVIQYRAECDGPFVWGYADRPWLIEKLHDLELPVEMKPSNALGGNVFFAIGRKN